MRRSKKLEWIDTGNYTKEEYHDCLKQLGRIAQLLGGNKATDAALDRIQKPIENVLDVGCGGGQAAARIAHRFPKAKVLAIDLNPEAIAYAKEHYNAPNLTFEVQKEEALDYPDEAFDLVHSSLVCHHIEFEKLIPFLQEMCRICRGTVVINDLKRSRIAWLLYAIIAPILFRNRMITHDGLLSIRRSFVKSDWDALKRETKLDQKSWCVDDHAGLFRWNISISKGAAEPEKAPLSSPQKRRLTDSQTTQRLSN